MDVEDAKRRAGEAAAERVEDGTTVGLGSGSTAAHAIRALGERVEAGLEVDGVATSYQSRAVARAAGIDLVEPEDVEAVDVAIDGADQVADGNLIKGGGGAHAREKLIDAAAGEFLVVVDERKLADALGAAVPLAVLPPARALVGGDVAALGGEATLRGAAEKSGPVVTDNGNLLLDCDFGRIDDPAELAAELDALPGVVEHGLFVGLADAVYVGTGDGVRTREG
ncbi:MAG: ribose-5-phosphate isomerase RpiA [Halobacteriales archaeon]